MTQFSARDFSFWLGASLVIATMLASLAWLRGGATSGSDAGGAGGMGSLSPTSLDPADWATLRASAHAVLDASLDKLEAASEGRVWTPVPDDLKEALRAPVPPEDGLAHGELCERLLALLPYGAGNTHPRFFGWVHGSGSPGGVLPELVGAAMNANCGGRDHVGIYVERQVLTWCKEMMGFPASAGGLLVSGTSMATVLALKAARHHSPASHSTAPRAAHHSINGPV